MSLVNLPEKGPGRCRQGITPTVMKRCVWVEPVLVAQVKFTEWTNDGQLRQPVFLGLRSDKNPDEIVREYRMPPEHRCLSRQELDSQAQ